jgi:hypothetical protein
MEVEVNGKFVLRYPDGRWVALDQASGGYPYPVTDIESAEWWYDEVRVRKYKETCRKENFKLYKIVSVIVGETA